jgi:hypothetical protein
MSHFIVYGLPRSRTHWLSHFLSYGDHQCRHEIAQYMRTADDLRAWLTQENTGTAETAAAPAWRLIHHYRPDIKAVVVRRPAVEVVASLLRIDLAGIGTYDAARLRKGMAYLDRCLDQIERLPSVLTVRFADLAQEETCARLFEHCLPYAHDHSWWSFMSGLNLQTNTRALMRYRFAHRAQIDRFKGELKAELRRLRRAGAFATACPS